MTTGGCTADEAPTRNAATTPLPRSDEPYPLDPTTEEVELARPVRAGFAPQLPLEAAILARVTRSSVLEVMGEDYIRTARAKGVQPMKLVVRHALGNALIPIVTLFGLDFGAAIGGGAILTESVFGLQGIGQYVAESIGSVRSWLRLA